MKTKPPLPQKPAEPVQMENVLIWEMPKTWISRPVGQPESERAEDVSRAQKRYFGKRPAR